MKKLVWAVDGSDCAWRAGEFAAQFLDAWPECQLVAVYCVMPIALPADTVIPARLELAEEERAEELKLEVQRRFARWEGRVRFRTERGYPVPTICAVADEEQADLIVMGSHGKNVINRVLLGSVSTAVLHRARQPVLTVR